MSGNINSVKPEFKVVIAGGREFCDFDLLCSEMDRLLVNKVQTHSIVIVSGKARGADALGETYAQLRGYSVISMPADWDKHGKSAGYKRNAEMAKISDATAAFWDGESRGTEHMINLTKRIGNQCAVVRY